MLSEKQPGNVPAIKTTRRSGNGYLQHLTQLYEGRKDYANQNPCTMVFELVKKLRKLTQ